MNVLVTGAGGFLGRYIVERLAARGDRIRAYCRSHYPALDALGVETVRGDLRDPEATVSACRGVDCVFHVASTTGISGAWQPYHDINTLGTRHVVEGCRRHGVGRLVYTSSPSVTFDGTDQRGVDESAPYAKRWLNHYSHSKALAEQQVLASNGRDGLATCALRPHLIWGPRDPHLIPNVIRRARAGRLRRVGDGTNLIDAVYVENAAAAHLAAADLLAIDSPVAGRAYFIGQGSPVNCWQWIDKILHLAGLPPVTKSMSLPTARAFGAVCELVWATLRLKSEPPMTRFLAAEMATSHHFDIARAREDFGYDPKVSTDEGLRRLSEAGFGDV